MRTWMTFALVLAACDDDSRGRRRDREPDPDRDPRPPGLAVTEREIKLDGKPVLLTTTLVPGDHRLEERLREYRSGKPQARLAGISLVVEPGAVAEHVLAVASAALLAGYPKIDVSRPGSTDPVCEMRSGPPSTLPDEELVRLGVLVQPDRVWVGQSRINEFTPVEPPFTDLAGVFDEIVSGHFFTDRHDAEIAAELGASGDLLLTVLAPMCKHFHPTPHTRETLTAKPTL